MLLGIRRSLLIQLLSVYLLFVVIVLIGGLAVNTVVEQKLRNDAQESDQALAQEIALKTSLQFIEAKNSLIALSQLALQDGTPDAMFHTFQAFQAARSDVDQVSWLDPIGILRVTYPPNQNVPLGTEFAPPDIVQRALNPSQLQPVFEVGIAIETTLKPDVIIANPVRDASGKLLGIVATSISLDEIGRAHV